MLNTSSAAQAGGAVLRPAAELLPGPSIRVAAAADAPNCFEVLTQAFESDPPSRWIWPDRPQYLEAFPRFARAFGGAAVGLGTAYCYDGFSGVALWLPPGSAPDEESLIAVICETVSEELREAAFSMFQQMDACHPKEPHWHLPLIGVHPASQGRGIGSALMSPVLDLCDRRRMPAYLEATSPRNIALYRRHGFEILRSIQVADSPPVVPMLRKPR